MCGRFALGIPRRLIRERFGLEAVADVPPRFNIAPGQLVEAVLAADPTYLEGGSLPGPPGPASHARERLVEGLAGRVGDLFGGTAPDTASAQQAEAGHGPTAGPPQPRVMGLFRWGLVPSWSRDPSMGARMVNARAETAWEKPAFRAAMRRRRCLIPAQGFYEWSGPPGRRQPWFFSPRDGALMALAGVWERCQSPAGEVIDSLAVLTCAANSLVSPLHDRMPVLVRPEDDARWLDPAEQSPSALADILASREWPECGVRMVGPRVNSARNEGADLLDPWPPLGG